MNRIGNRKTMLSILNISNNKLLNKHFLEHLYFMALNTTYAERLADNDTYSL